MKKTGFLTMCLLLGLNPLAQCAVRHKVSAKDTMWDLAAHYYKDPFKWHKIAEANPPPNVHDPHWIYPGQILVIPDLEEKKAVEQAKEPEEGQEVDEAIAEPQPDVEPQPELPTAPAKPAVSKRPSDESNLDSTSIRLPPGLVPQQSSSPRVKLSQEWKPDGEVVESDEEIAVAAQGSWVNVHIDSGDVRKGERYLVLRHTSPMEDDKDQDALYAVKIGVLEVRKPVSEKIYKAIVVRTSDSIQVGDVLRKED